jgi:transposase
MIELAWFWLRHQPDSALSRWFQARVGAAKGRIRRIAIVAAARKLLVALWRYVAQGVVPEGAVFKTAWPNDSIQPTPAKLNATASPDPGGR